MNSDLRFERCKIDLRRPTIPAVTESGYMAREKPGSGPQRAREVRRKSGGTRSSHRSVGHAGPDSLIFASS
jgi:hypothetical protein